MNVINVGKCSYEDLVSVYTIDRLMDYPVKSCREWLRTCTNAVEWCGSEDGFDELVQAFECHYLAYAVRLCSFKAVIFNQSK